MEMYVFYWDKRQDNELASYEGWRVDSTPKGRSGSCKAQAPTPEGQEVPETPDLASGWTDGSTIEMAVVAQEGGVLIGGAAATRKKFAGLYALVVDHKHDHAGKKVFKWSRHLSDDEVQNVQARVEELGLANIPVGGGCCAVS
jgi:hypothetical protein